ncbi:MAG: class I SAM-dependent methyltransferase [Gammaproteobacteria bacterium]|nr:class I SAM-dependent methyltransferase [Gammaproteobacteria bacterium]
MSEHFAADWLALREPADHRARPDTLINPLNAAIATSDVIRVLDLGAGTGSNYRYLAPKLIRPQRWTLYDHDPALLAHTASEHDVTPLTGDLQVLIGPYGQSLLAKTDLITASALLDLVSAAWLDALIEQIVARRIPALFALSYNGHIESIPATAADQALVQAVNAHQRSEKGFGPALGPDAGSYCAERFRHHGYHVYVAESPWLLGPDEAELQQLLITGWIQAASAVQPGNATAFAQWQQDHLHQISHKRLRVGHQDLLALPA